MNVQQGQERGVVVQRFRHEAKPRHDRAPAEGAARIDPVDGDGRAGVDHDGGCARPAQGIRGDGIEQAVDADPVGIIDLHAQRKLRGGVKHEHGIAVLPEPFHERTRAG